VLSSIIEPFRGRVSVAIVWIPMLPEDSAAAAGVASALFDSTVAQFFDAHRLLGAAIASAVSASTTAWDIYLMYGRAQRWEDGAPPPAPVAYAHQLGDWADASRYRTGADLRSELRHMAEQIVNG
jgi:hypothetical protein